MEMVNKQPIIMVNVGARAGNMCSRQDDLMDNNSMGRGKIGNSFQHHDISLIAIELSRTTNSGCITVVLG